MIFLFELLFGIHFSDPNQDNFKWDWWFNASWMLSLFSIRAKNLWKIMKNNLNDDRNTHLLGLMVGPLFFQSQVLAKIWLQIVKKIQLKTISGQFKEYCHFSPKLFLFFRINSSLVKYSSLVQFSRGLGHRQILKSHDNKWMLPLFFWWNGK